MGYPTEIFDVTGDIVEDWEKCEKIISHRLPFGPPLEALEFAATPGGEQGRRPLRLTVSSGKE